jgi:NADH-quinone oxidoreductase subunit M
VFAAGYLLWLYQRTAFGTPNDEFAEDAMADVQPPEWIAWAPMLVLILAIGVYPNIVFRISDGQLSSLSQWIAAFGG